MTRKGLMDNLLAAARTAYDEGEAAAVSYMIAEKIFGFSRVDVALEPLRKVTFSLDFNRLLTDISSARPVQYIIGKAEFRGIQFAVGQGVLIPRPETEELVGWVLEETNPQSGLSILDVGTGSGAIAIYLAKSLPEAHIVAIDVSQEALKFARINNSQHEAGVEIVQADIFDFSPAEKFDIIVSNPPYIPETERVAMHKNVIDYEPATALFVPDDNPLIFYRVIARLARKILKPNGALFFEIYHSVAYEATELLHSEGFSQVVVRKDINGKHRMIKAAK